MKRIGELKAEVHHFKFILEEERQIAREDWAGLRTENARLEAEVERLKAFTTRTIIPNEELQAQVERLTKAGDSLVWAFEKGSHQTKADAINVWIDIKAWHAAKEVQS